MNIYSNSSGTYSKSSDMYPRSIEISNTMIHSHQNGINDDINLKFYVVKYQVVLWQWHMPLISFRIKFKSQNITGTKPWSVGFPNMNVAFLDTTLCILVLAYPSTKRGVCKSGHMMAPNSFTIITAVFFPP